VIVRHSAALTGVTESRPMRRIAMCSSSFRALISASVTGFVSCATARRSTMNQVGATVSDFGS
jgi:hypothetical protein